MTSFDLSKAGKTMAVSLLFFSPVFIWFALAITGVTGTSAASKASTTSAE